MTSSSNGHLVEMEQWSGAERAVAVKAYYKNGDSATAAQRQFRRHYDIPPRGRVPSSHAILTWVRNFEETGSALKKKPPGRVVSVRTPENVDAVRVAVERSPRRSVRKIASSLQLNRRSVQRILHSLHFHPYKLQIVQALKPNDGELRLAFCQQLLTKINDDANFLENLWMSDEAHFHLNGHVNKQNMRYWAQQNPAELHQRPLHSPKVTVWCAVSGRGVIGPYFFEDENGSTVTVTSQRYVHMLETFFAPRLHAFPDIEIQQTWFQQDGATSHTANLSMAALRRLFGERIISRNANVTWPPRSPDLSVCDFFLWGHLKSVVYQTRPRNLIDLKTQIEEHIANIPEYTLRRTMLSLQNRLNECVRRNGQHLTDVIFKK